MPVQLTGTASLSEESLSQRRRSSWRVFEVGSLRGVGGWRRMWWPEQGDFGFCDRGKNKDVNFGDSCLSYRKRVFSQ